MPGPLGEPDKPVQQSGGDHLDALVEAIGNDPKKLFELLGVQGPAPQAPQFSQQPYLPPAQAAAGALNPDLARLFTQRQQFNQTGQYTAAQNAFGEQMQSRRAAAAGLVGMYGANQRAVASQGDPLDYARIAEINRHNRAMEDIGRSKLNNPPATNLQAHDTPNGPQWFDPRNPNAPGVPLTGANNKPVPPKTDPNVLGNFIATNSVLHDLDELQQLMDSAYKKHGAAWRLAAGTGSETPGFKSITGYVDPLAQRHEALRQALILEANRPITQQSRLLQAEITQMEKSFPTYGTSPDVYMPLIQKMRERLQNIDRVQRALFPGQASELDRINAVGGDLQQNESIQDRIKRIYSEQQ